jgi:hypothetical protein
MIGVIIHPPGVGSHTRFSQVASLQGYLLNNKTRPRECVEEVAEWSRASILVGARGTDFVTE